MELSQQRYLCSRKIVRNYFVQLRVFHSRRWERLVGNFFFSTCRYDFERKFQTSKLYMEQDSNKQTCSLGAMLQYVCFIESSLCSVFYFCNNPNNRLKGITATHSLLLPMLLHSTSHKRTPSLSRHISAYGSGLIVFTVKLPVSGHPWYQA